MKYLFFTLSILLRVTSYTQPFDFDWIEFPVGSFIMGSPENEERHDEFEVQHNLTFSA